MLVDWFGCCFSLASPQICFPFLSSIPSGDSIWIYPSWSFFFFNNGSFMVCTAWILTSTNAKECTFTFLSWWFMHYRLSAILWLFIFTFWILPSMASSLDCDRCVVKKVSWSKVETSKKKEDGSARFSTTIHLYSLPRKTHFTRILFSLSTNASEWDGPSIGATPGSTSLEWPWRCSFRLLWCFCACSCPLSTKCQFALLSVVVLLLYRSFYVSSLLLLVAIEESFFLFAFFSWFFQFHFYSSFYEILCNNYIVQCFYLALFWLKMKTQRRIIQFYRRKVDSLKKNISFFISNLTVRDGLQTPRSLWSDREGVLWGRYVGVRMKSSLLP